MEFKTGVYEPVFRLHLANLLAADEIDPAFTEGLAQEICEDSRYVSVPRPLYLY